MGADRLAELFDAHHLRLYRLARRLAGDPEAARDLVQQTFLRAARRPAALPTGEPGGEAWLVRTLVNLCRDRHRRRRVRQAAVLPRAVGRGSDPEARAVARATVAVALAALPPRQRAVVALHYLEDRDAGDIARLLGLARVTVRWHLAAARRRLRQILMPEADT